MAKIMAGGVEDTNHRKNNSLPIGGAVNGISAAPATIK